jgi:F-type H+-transporting ATPase subunit delta
VIHAASRGALAELREWLRTRLRDGANPPASGPLAALAHLRDAIKSQLLDQPDPLAALPPEEFAGLAGELHQVSRLLEVQPRLRRALGDPSTSADRRTGFARNLLTGKISDSALSLVAQAVSLRWSNPWDLTDALSIVGDELLLDSAQRAGHLDNVEDELFRFGRILRAQDDLRGLLDEQSVPAERRIGLLTEVVGNKVDPVTLALLDQAVRSGRKRTIELAIDDLLERTAELRGQSVADVSTAVALTDEQEQRLGAALSRWYDRTITVRTLVDPSIQGGLVVRIGNEIIDGSVAHRLAVVRAELAG